VSLRPLARPGCLWIPGSTEVRVVCSVSGTSSTARMRHCRLCGTENHLEKCLDCEGYSNPAQKCVVCGNQTKHPKFYTCSPKCNSIRCHTRLSNRRWANRRKDRQPCQHCGGAISLSKHGSAKTCSPECAKARKKFLSHVRPRKGS
jgi:hypothetical protein